MRHAFDIELNFNIGFSYTSFVSYLVQRNNVSLWDILLDYNDIRWTGHTSRYLCRSLVELVLPKADVFTLQGSLATKKL